MNPLKNMRIGARLGLAFGVVLVLLASLSSVAIVSMSQLNADAEKIVSNDWVKATLVSSAIDNVRGSIARVFQFTNETDKEHVAKARERFDANVKGFSEALTKVEPLIQSSEGKALLAKATESGAKYVAATAKVFALIEAKDREAANKQAFGASYTALQAFAADLRALNELQQKRVVDAGAANTKAFETNRAWVVGLAVFAIGLGILFAWLVTRSITAPIKEALKVAETVAAGDLTSHIDVTSKDETGQLLAALKAMNESLVGIVSNVRQSSDSIATGSSQIATGNADLSQRTEEQASNLQQTAASMEELTATVKQNSDTARQANQLANSASEAAAKGGVVVGQVVSTMEAITASSKKISDIISVIDGIAFQTNILALNAAVEAARAGEQGRGFAVVASEVRSLAGRSADAAKEIKTLIGESVEKVETGSKLVGDAGKSMEDIVSQVKRVNDLIAEISAASLEQTQGIGQVGDAITQLDQVTQQNAALVEESAAAADSLSQQAAKLAEIVGVFRLGAGEGYVAPAVAAPSHANQRNVERRGPSRATNVTRPKFAAKAPNAAAASKANANAATSNEPASAKTGTDDAWTSF